MSPKQRVLTLPGWLGSGPGHWQTVWESQHGDERVEQADWVWPRRGDWMARLDGVLLDGASLDGALLNGQSLADERPVVLVAHSLGCHLVAAWAAHSQHTGRVLGALLVAPPDTERPDMPPQLHNWRPMVRQRLPFPATVVYSEDDPFCSVATARGLADAWGAGSHQLGAAGHINAESGLADWPAGRALLQPWLACAFDGPREHTRNTPNAPHASSTGAP